MTIYSIGYEGLSIETFMSLLEEYNIETVVDVRELPLSRKSGFSKKTFANLLNLSGFEYIHMAHLGCPRDVRNRYREDNDWNRYTQGFLEYLRSQESAIVELSHLASRSNSALVCYEADYRFCHRSMIINAVRDHGGLGVKHIEARTAKSVQARTRSLVTTDLVLA